MATQTVVLTDEEVAILNTAKKQAATSMAVAATKKASKASAKALGNPATDPAAFTIAAIKALRQLPENKGSKGIHCRFSGHNDMLRSQFPGIDAVAHTQALAAKGLIEIVPCKGGVRLYLPGEVPARAPRDLSASLALVLG
jgi:hypothetical protein